MQGRRGRAASVWASGRSMADWWVKPGEDRPCPFPRAYMATSSIPSASEGWRHFRGGARNLCLCLVLLRKCSMSCSKLLTLSGPQLPRFLALGLEQ